MSNDTNPDNDGALVERRPDSKGENRSVYPAAWGPPPEGVEARKRWAREHVSAATDEVRRGGQKPDWLYVPGDRHGR